MGKLPADQIAFNLSRLISIADCHNISLPAIFALAMRHHRLKRKITFEDVKHAGEEASKRTA